MARPPAALIGRAACVVNDAYLCRVSTTLRVDGPRAALLNGRARRTLDVVERAVHILEEASMIRQVVPLLLVVLAAVAPARAVTVTETHAATAQVGGDKVNINTASAKELQKLEGIGRSVAERIVQYREAHGPFKRGQDLRKVEGVGETLWEKNRERIIVK
jgi:competence protein ComEA